MGDKVKKEPDQVVLDADPVEAVALTYDSKCIPVKYQKIGGDARTPQRGSAQAVGYDVYSAVNGEIPTDKTVHFLSNIITKPKPVSKAIQQVQPCSKPFGMHPWSTDGYRQQLQRNCDGATSQLFEGQTIPSEKGASNCTAVIERCYKIYWDHDENLQDMEPIARGLGGFGSTGC